MTQPAAKIGTVEERSSRLFRILGYGAIIFLVGILLLAVYEPVKLTDAVRTILVQVVLTVVFAGSIALSVLYILSQKVLSAASVSPLTRRWLRTVMSAALISFVSIVLTAVGLGNGWADLFLSLPFWLPCFLIFFYLRGSPQKTGLALAVAMGCTLFLAFPMMTPRSPAEGWRTSWLIRDSLALATLPPLVMAAAAIRTYYTMPRERGDLGKLLWSGAYGFALLSLLISVTGGRR